MIGKFLCFIGWHHDHAIPSSKDKHEMQSTFWCQRVPVTLRHVECCRCGSACWTIVRINF